MRLNIKAIILCFKWVTTIFFSAGRLHLHLIIVLSIWYLYDRPWPKVKPRYLNLSLLSNLKLQMYQACLFPLWHCSMSTTNLASTGFISEMVYLHQTDISKVPHMPLTKSHQAEPVLYSKSSTANDNACSLCRFLTLGIIESPDTDQWHTCSGSKFQNECHCSSV